MHNGDPKPNQEPWKPIPHPTPPPDPTKKPERNDPTTTPDPSKNDPTRITPDQPPQPQA